MRVALVYDRVNKFGGAERVLGALHRIWPEAPVYTSVYDREGAPWADGWDIRTSWLMNIPGAKTNHESLGWLMPLAFESLDLSGFEVVISVTSEAAKGIITTPRQLHICYLLTPTRYLWSHTADYLGQLPGIIRPLAMAVQSKLRVWDYTAGQRPDYILAISEHVKKRCLKYYRREAEVIYPPVTIGLEDARRADPRYHFLDTLGSESSLTSASPLGQFKRKDSLGSFSIVSKMTPSVQHNYQLLATNYYMVVSRLVPYKRIDLAIEACNRLKENLVVVGSGTDEGRLKGMAGPTVRFAGNLTDRELVGYYRRAKALLMPQEEDFGLTAVEALSCGTPVISFRNSGAAEVITDGETGVLFDSQTVPGLIAGMEKLEKTKITKEDCQKQAEKFSEERFKEKFLKTIEKLTRLPRPDPGSGLAMTSKLRLPRPPKAASQ